jgi:hypothetical protein
VQLGFVNLALGLSGTDLKTIKNPEAVAFF